MKKFTLLFICTGIFATFLVRPLFAADGPPESSLLKEWTPQSYEDFKALIATNCDAPSKPWMNSKEGWSLSAPPEYPEFNAAKINAHIQEVVAADTRWMLAEELDATRIWNLDGLKALEIARIEYRWVMNDLFACAVIDSRILILKDLQEKIRSKFPTPNSELTNKLNNEANRLEQIRETMIYCTAPKSSDIPIEIQIKNTSTRQYCHFSHYLNYLKEHLEKNNAVFMNTEKVVGSGDGTEIPENTNDWVNQMRLRQTQIENELIRAKRTPVRALLAFKEMRRTYPIHIMLVVLLDDYLRLRENLNRYLNANSQLFEKMDNAQDANER